METITYSAMHMRARDVDPRQHTDHGNGTYSVALTPAGDAASAYFVGTPDELSDLVDRLKNAAHDARTANDARIAELRASRGAVERAERCEVCGGAIVAGPPNGQGYARQCVWCGAERDLSAAS